MGMAAHSIPDDLVEVLGDPAQASAMLDPTRRAVIGAIGPGDSASGVARKLGLPRQKVNYHMRELEKLGLVELIEERRKGNCIERIVRARASSYVLDPGVLGPLGADPDRVRDRFSAAYLVSTGARMIRELSELMRRSGKAGKQISTLTIDADVRFASAKDQAAFAEELSRRLASLISEYHNESAPDGRAFRVVACAYQAITKPDKTEPGDRPPEPSEHHHD